MWKTEINEKTYEHLFNTQRQKTQGQYSAISKISGDTELHLVALKDGGVAGLTRTTGHSGHGYKYTKDEVSSLGQQGILDDLQA